MLLTFALGFAVVAVVSFLAVVSVEARDGEPRAQVVCGVIVVVVLSMMFGTIVRSMLPPASHAVQSR